MSKKGVKLVHRRRSVPSWVQHPWRASRQARVIKSTIGSVDSRVLGPTYRWTLTVQTQVLVGT